MGLFTGPTIQDGNMSPVKWSCWTYPDPSESLVLWDFYFFSLVLDLWQFEISFPFFLKKNSYFSFSTSKKREDLILLTFS